MKQKLITQTYYSQTVSQTFVTHGGRWEMLSAIPLGIYWVLETEKKVNCPDFLGSSGGRLPVTRPDHLGLA